MNAYLIVILCLAVVANAALAEAGSGPVLSKVTIVKPAHAPWLVDHAASELAKYVELMTGSAPDVRTGQSSESASNTVIELSVGSKANELRAKEGANDPERLRDGFVVKAESPNRLLIAAVEPVGLLYGVYDYLERWCNVGFFWEGENVPKLAKLPVQGVYRAELPRWTRRFFGLSDGFGLAKYHNRFRTKEQREQILDWMAKHKLNLSHIGLYPSISYSGESGARVFGLDDKQPDNWLGAGWPGALDFPAKVRTKITKDQLQYGRERGMKWVYYLAYGSLPHQYSQTHPEMKYVPGLGYGAAMLYPDDPECERLMSAFYKDLIKTYGTDHIYQDTPYCESSGAKEPEDSFKLKLQAAQTMCKVYKKLDPKAIWHSDSWDFTAIPHVWTQDRMKRYFESLPRDMMFMYDTASDFNPFWNRSNYFYGINWAFGVLHSFQGDDGLHGDMADILKRARTVCDDPKAVKCKGVYVVPESSGHNLLYFELVSRLAWNPDDVNLDSFLRDYALRRYGKANQVQMLRAVKGLAGSVYSGGGWMPIYKKLGCGYGPGWWPIVGAKEVDDKTEGMPRDFEGLREAVRTAYACRDNLSGNSLYMTDLVDWTRTYLSYVFNWSVLDAYKALRQGDAARVHANAKTARETMLLIESVLSTRPDFHLQPQIEQAMKVPGTNTYLPWYMKQHCVNDLYSSNEVYEQMHWFYGPRMEVYLAEIEKRADSGEKVVEWNDIAQRCEDFRSRWLNEDIAVPEKDRFHGTTMDAINIALNKYLDFRPNSGSIVAAPASTSSLVDQGNVKGNAD